MKLIPADIPSHSPRSESIVMGMFKNSSLQGTLMHSLSIPRTEDNIERELDFVIISEYGVFVLEVKGGLISFRNGEWFSTDFFGHTHKIKDPFKQAQSASHLLMRKILRTYPRMSNYLFESIVCFPDNSNIINSFEYSKDKVIGAKDLYDQRSFDAKLSKIFEKYEYKYRKDSYKKEKILGGQRETIKQLLRPDFEGKVDYRNATLLMKKRLIELSDEQNVVYNQLSQNPRILVYGVAGTGKTVLALAKLKDRQTKEGSTLLLCYNRLLAEELKSNFLTSSHDKQNVKIATIDSFILDTLHRYATTDESFKAELNSVLNGTEDFTIKQEKLAYLFGDIPANKMNKYHYLIIDEAQDIITNSSYYDVVSMSLRDGIKHGNWSMFADTHQNIFHTNTRELADVLDENGISYATWSLSRNMRSTNQIVATVKDYSDIECENSGIEGPRVRTVDGTKDSVPIIEGEIERLFSMGFLPQHITLLTTNSLQEDLITSLSISNTAIRPFEGMNRKPIVKSKPDADREICYSSVYKFKGLENDAIILLISDKDSSLKEQYSSMLNYIGITRARFMLVVIKL